MTGFPLQVRALIIQRAQGMCERCSLAEQGMQIHHRRPRGMGGSRREDTNQAANGLYLCADCHVWVESHRSEALAAGLLVRSRQSPAAIPVLWRDQWCLLDDDGYTYQILVPVGGGV